MSLDAAKVTLYAVVGPTNDKLVASKVTMYAVVRPTGAAPAPVGKQTAHTSSQIIYRADS